MLVLSRKLDETIVIDGNIRIKVIGVSGKHVRLGIEAPDRMTILREELIARDRAGIGTLREGATRGHGCESLSHSS